MKRKKSGVQERKLLLYQILPKKFKTGFETESLKNSSKLHQTYTSQNAPFRVVLIGLDGDVKLEQLEILSAEKLFKTIDRMPMRQTEMRKNR